MLLSALLTSEYRACVATTARIIGGLLLDRDDVTYTVQILMLLA